MMDTNQKDMYLKQIGLRAYNMMPILGSIVNITRETYVTISTSTGIFRFDSE